MLKIKTLLPVFAMVLVLGLSNAAFAQLSCNVASTPVSRATDTGLTETAGDLIFNCTFGTVATTSAVMTVDYGVPITNATNYPIATPVPLPIQVVTGTGAAPSVFSVANATGQVVIAIPPQTANLSFTLTGVLLAISGSGKTSVTANVSVSPGSGVLITAGQTNAVVITSVLPGIKAPHLTTNTSAGIILGPGQTITTPINNNGGFSVAIDENYIDMFRSQSQFNNGASTQGVQLLLSFAGIPAGLTFAGGTTATTPCTASIASPGTVTFISTNNTVTSTTNTVLLEITGTPSLAALDTVTFACSNAVVGTTATLPLTPGSITMTTTLAPTGTAFSSTGGVLTSATTGQIPRYTSTPIPSPALVVANIIPAATDMLFPFVSVGNGFDTGFAIANTTGDPFGGTANGGARAQNGTVAMYWFPVTGNAFCIVTGGTATNPVTGGTGATNCTALSSTTVGQGLSAGGVVNAGASWIVLASEVLRGAAGSPTTFNGYVFAVANFSNAHPTWFVADAAFSGKFASGGPTLVLAPPQVAPRTGVTGVESLGH